jgi:hypothetical protein
MAIPEKGRKKKKKGYLGDPHKDETKKSVKKALRKGKIEGFGRKKAKETKKYAKDIGTAFKEGFVDTAKLGWEGSKVLAGVGKGFIKEMLNKKSGGPIRMNKGGSVDAKKIAKKYFKGTF